VRIVHVAPFAPGRCGLYETAAELIMAERELGHSVDLIDVGVSGAAPLYGTDPQHGLTARDTTAAVGADLIVSHTGMPPAVLAATPAPVVHVLHGRPEGSFRLQQEGRNPVYDFVAGFVKNPRYKAFVSFWPEYHHYWAALVPDGRLFSLKVPPVDLRRFKPEGEEYDFDPDGYPNVAIADVGREDVTPYHILHALSHPEVVRAFPRMKVHVFGLPPKLGAYSYVLDRHKDLGIAGEHKGMMRGMSLILRSADTVITAHRISTRIVREGLASGTPVVARNGCPWTPFTFDPEDPASLINPLSGAISGQDPRESARALARVFDHNAVGAAFLDLCERHVLGATSAQ